MDMQASESGWHRASARAADPRPGLKLNLDVDICIIGGGIAGLSAALEAARLGASVAVIEAKRIGWNASGASLGIVAPGFGNDVSDLIVRIGRDHVRELWALSQEGVDRVREIASELPQVDLVDGLLEVSTTDNGSHLVSRLEALGDVFAADVEGWQTDRVRSEVKTQRYFQAIHYGRAFHLHALNYVRGLAELALRAGVQIFEQTHVTSIDATGIRKRIVTPDGRLRANHIVLAGSVHLGALFPKLVQTLLPVWRFAGVTEPLGERLADAVSFKGAVLEADTGNLFRIVGGDRLMWSGPVRASGINPKRLYAAILKDLSQTFPRLKPVALADVWSGVIGETVHGMLQIGQMNPGLWIASGFGRQGFNTAAMAGRLIARGILAADDRWKLFAPYELVWAGGLAGRLVRQAAEVGGRKRAVVAGLIAQRRDRMRLKTADRAGVQSATVTQGD